LLFDDYFVATTVLDILHQVPLPMYNSTMATHKKKRMTSGQFAPGISGNPGGRPKDEARVAELARSYTIEAIDTLVELMRYGKDDRVRGTAAQALLDRGWGKPKVEVVADGAGSYIEALRLINEQIAADQSIT
jgi:hypothetical protein